MRRAVPSLLAVLFLAGCADQGPADESAPPTSDGSTDPNTGEGSPANPTAQVLPEPTVIFERTQNLLDVPAAANPFEQTLDLDPGRHHVFIHWSAAGSAQYQLFLQAGDRTIYISPPRDAEGDPDSQGPPKRVGEAEAATDQVTLRVEWSGLLTYTVRVEAWASATLRFASLSFGDGGGIPLRHTCGGDGVSPSLEWSDAPQGAAVFALLMEDLDLPGGGVFTHWWMRNIPLNVTAVAEGQEPPSGETDPDRGYFGPCPPSDETHRYLFKILALDQPLAIESKPPAEQLRGRVLAHGFLVGRFGCPSEATCSLDG